MKKILLTSILLTLILIVKAQTPPIVYVTGDGSGDYNCDGTSDQEQINQALDFVASNSEYTTVYLKGENTFWISEPIYISANTILEGDADAVIKLIDNAGWDTKFKPLIAQKGHVLRISLEDTTITTGNITIRGFEIDGNREHQSEPSGNSYYNMICLQNCYNTTINDMYMHHNLSDVLNTIYDVYGFNANLKFFNNRVHGSGHDGIYVENSENIEIYNNIFTNNRTDAHIRLQYCNHFKVHDNICGNAPDSRNSGGVGIDIQVKGTTPLNDAEIYSNFIYGKGAFPGIWLWQTHKGGKLDTHRYVHIHNNVIVGNQGAGISILGFNNTFIENNVIEYNGDGDNRAILSNVHWAKQSGITFYEGADKNNIKGFKTIVQNNIIGNSASYGIENKKPRIHTFISNNNCIYNNLKGNYKDASSTTDIYIYPDYACENPAVFENRTNYVYNILSHKWIIAEETNNYSCDLGANEAWSVFHLKSKEGRWDGAGWVYDDVTSFCINQGDANTDYFNEPEPNGGRVNIGAFGNTEYASMSSKIANINHFAIYPNPTTGKIAFSDEFENNDYEIMSLTGQLVKKGIVNAKEINVQELSTGFYIIKIRKYKSNKNRIVKFVKQ